MRTDCIVKLSKLKIFELNTLVQKETSSHVERKSPPSDKNIFVLSSKAYTMIVVRLACHCKTLENPKQDYTTRNKT
jgi:hypothetical protein